MNLMQPKRRTEFRSTTPVAVGVGVPRSGVRLIVIVASCIVGFFTLTGCHDGPLYALKNVNPYFTMREWKADRELGVTDHERRNELAKLVDSIGQQSLDRQQYWLGELNKIMEYDPSAEMRRLAVAAAGNAKDAAALALIETGLDDEDLKVRMEACRALGRIGSEDAARLLAATVGTEPDEDVRKSAVAALGNYSNEIATGALKNALSNRDPSMRAVAMNSLRLSTGKDYGDEPAQWIAALESNGQNNGKNNGQGDASADESETQIAGREDGLF